ncbi:Kinesin-like protein CIN8 [Spathaspora sp. JA1]|nr:Kinesin-like protein CIN8 [Spathaspora sp. JA1]
MSNIQVVVRCRSRNTREIEARSPIVVELTDERFSIDEPYITINHNNHIIPSDPSSLSNQRTYKVDQVYGSQADQSLLFKNVALPLFHDFLDGFNVTILAYGQTGTGKTFTMCGNEPETNKFEEGDEQIGIIPRVLRLLFEELKETESDYVVKCSYLELYNEELKDLLQDDSTSRPLKIYEQASKSGKPSIKIQNLCERQITDYKQGFKFLKMGLDKRKTSSTKLNDASSRSHTIFTINLYKSDEQQGSGDSRYHIAKMNLVDLAGSENISRSGSIVKETGSINQSLLTLGRVINSLSEKQQQQKSTQHIPYRESKLTRLLQDSIGGNTKTTLIATISPAKVNIDETCSTLDYASKAKSIKNIPQIGHESDSIIKKVLVKNLSAEIVRLNSDLIATRNKNGIYLDAENYENLIQENEALKTSLRETQIQNDSINFKLQEVKESNKLEIDKITQRINRLDGKNKQLVNHNTALLADINNKSIENEQLTQKLNRASIEISNSSNQLAQVLFQNLDSSISTIRDIITTDNQRHNIDDLVKTQSELTSQFQKYNSDIEDKFNSYNNKVQSLVNNDLSIILDNYRQLFDTVSNDQREYVSSLEQQILQLKKTVEKMESYLSADKLTSLRGTLYQEVSGISQQIFSEFKQAIVRSIENSESKYKNRLCDRQMEIINLQVDNERQILDQHAISWKQRLDDIFPLIEQDLSNHENKIQSHIETAKKVGVNEQNHIDELLNNKFEIRDISQPDISKLESISKNLTNVHEKHVKDLSNVNQNLAEIESFDTKNAFKISPIKSKHSPKRKLPSGSSPARNSPPVHVSRIARSSTMGKVQNRDDTKIPKLIQSKSFEENKRRKVFKELNNL